MNRREFLVGSTVAAGFLLTHPLVQSKTYTGSQLLLGDGEDAKSTKLILSGSDGNFKTIQAPCKAHEVCVNPVNRSQVFGPSKWGKSAYLADIKKLSLIKTVEAAEGESFYGHSLYSQDGKNIFCSMMDEKKNEGFISVRDSQTLAELGRFPSNGIAPHQMRWVEQDKTIAVINSVPLITDPDQNHSNLSVVNAASGELVKNFPTSIRRHSHFSLMNHNEEVLLCRAASHGDLTLYEKLSMKDGSLVRTKEDVAVSGERTESLSHILFENKSIAVMTIIGFNRLVFWDYKNNKVLFKKDFKDKPQGIIQDHSGQNIFVTFYSPSGSFIHVYPTKKFMNFDLTPAATLKGGSGSHLTII